MIDKIKRFLMHKYVVLFLWVLTLFIVFYLLSGCSTHGRLTAIHDFQGESLGGNPVINMQIYREYKQCEYGIFHQSHLLAGRPFNDREEDVIDGVYGGCNLW